MKPAVTIEGEDFHLEEEYGQVYLTHPRWSLMGMGSDLAQAMFDVRVRARILWPVYADARDLTLRALEMRDYLYSVMVADPTDEDGNCLCSMCQFG